MCRLDSGERCPCKRSACYGSPTNDWRNSERYPKSDQVKKLARTLLWSKWYAKDALEKRDAWLNPPGTTELECKDRTLTNLYNKRPSWLADAHRKLDEAVFAAYGWPPTLTDSEILERLLALNHERAAKSAGAERVTQHS